MSGPSGYTANAVWGVQARAGGFVVMFRAFFDETQSHKGERITGVSACLFDSVGYETFAREWGPRVEEFGSFSISDLYWGHKPFSGAKWHDDRRVALWTELGNLIRKTRLASFVSFVTHADFESYTKEQPSIERVVGNPYALCLLHCAFIVADFAKSKNIESVLYSFEAGGPKWKDAAALMERSAENPKVKEYLRLRGFGFADKAIEPALYSADYLAWGWQRSYATGAGRWHETFEIVRSDKDHPLYVSRLTEGKISRQVLFNLFYGLDADRMGFVD